MTCKTEEAYNIVFMNIINCVGTKIEVEYCMHDFEKAIINAVMRWFVCLYHLGCFFHWMQAINKNLVDWGFSKDCIKLILWRFKFLTIIDPSHMRAGVEYIRQKVHDDKKVKKREKVLFDQFLNEYFIKTWLTEKLISMFNYKGEGRDLGDM